ncbi:hypothetical protein ACEV6G_20340 [Enterobacter ludwigii]|uniref:hypothetical protein n=1 Tax=Enterobacteriaceae TaxID=543 RepID=UPI00325D9F7C|nr:hypothetical protein [Escherichia coli]EKD5635558.1 hypothetical protein [Escherichia coli]
MGASITTQLQILSSDGWEDVYDQIFTRYGEATSSPFTEQNYAQFAFIADVRNFACIPVICNPRGLPAVNKQIATLGWGGLWEFNSRPDWPKHEDNHSATWFLVSELLEYDYEAVFENRRDDSNPHTSLPIGCGELMTIRECIGPKFFEDLEILRQKGDPDKMRVIFSFSG